jgi:hypothetical protein
MELESNFSLMIGRNFGRTLCTLFLGFMTLPVVIFYFSGIYEYIGIILSIIVTIISWIFLIYLWMSIFRKYNYKLSNEYGKMIENTQDDLNMALEKYKK